jgi:hypothetical protein
MKTSLSFSMIFRILYGLIALTSATAYAEGQVGATPTGAPVVQAAIQGLSDFIVSSEVAYACGWTTKDHARLETARQGMVHNDLHALLASGDLSERELNEAYGVVMSTAFNVEKSQKALELTKQGACENVQIKAQWNMIASNSLLLQATTEGRLAALNPLNKLISLNPFKSSN